MKKPLLIVAVVVLGVMGALALKDGRLLPRKADTPPVIEFTWSPAGAVSLLEMKAKLRLVDDHELDFKSYKMTLVEADRVLELPQQRNLIGKEYEDTLSFSLIAGDSKLVDKEKLTVRIEIKDDAGQLTQIERTIKLRAAPIRFELMAP